MVANNLLRWLRDFADSRADGRITMDVAAAALKMRSVDCLGLGELERRYLTTIIRVFSGGPAGIEAIAHTMNLAVDTLSDEVEPFLLRTELVVRTPRGRVATGRAYERFGFTVQGEVFDVAGRRLDLSNRAGQLTASRRSRSTAASKGMGGVANSRSTLSVSFLTSKPIA